MFKLIVFFAAILLSVKSISYGIWSIKNKHAPEGVFAVIFCTFSVCLLYFAFFMQN